MDRSRRFPEDVTEELDNVLRLRLATKDDLNAHHRNRHRRMGRDWAEALEAVQQASDTMTATENRARDVEARGVALAEKAMAELQAAEARVQAAEARLQIAESRIQTAEETARLMEARALDAEARAQEAEEWLARLNDAIQDRLLVRRDGYRSNAA